MAQTYNVYQDSVKVKEGIAAPPVDITGLSPETEYNFQVSSVLDGVESELSESLTVSTIASAISVTGVTIAPKNATGTTGTANTKQFSATVAPAGATNKAVTYSMTPTTAGYSIAPSTGLVSWTEVAAPAVITVTVTTTDGAKKDTGTLTTTAPAG